MVKLEKYGPASSSELYPFHNLYLILSLDSVLYFLLAIYFDKVLPGEWKCEGENANFIGFSSIIPCF